MSQIVTITEFVVTNIKLAKETARELGYDVDDNKDVMGSGNGKADFVFKVKNASYNMGLRKRAESNEYDLICDSVVKDQVTREFISNYNKNIIENRMKLVGRGLQTMEDTAEHIVLRIY